MKQTVSIVVSLAVGFALGYLAANMDFGGEYAEESIAPAEDKNPSSDHARAGSSTDVADDISLGTEGSDVSREHPDEARNATDETLDAVEAPARGVTEGSTTAPHQND